MSLDVERQQGGPLWSDELRAVADRLAALEEGEVVAVDAWWRASNYLTIGQIYLQANVLLTEPLAPEHVKPRLLGHWGTSPGLSFVYAHVSRLIRHTGQQAVYLARPGHGGPALVAVGWIEGTYSEIYPEVSRDAEGMRRLCRQFSTPGGIPSHVSVTTPGSIHEGGELGYVLLHAFGAVMDNPDLLAVAVVGDGEAETGPLEGDLVPQPGPGRRRAAGAAPERRQDLRPHGPGPQGPGRGPVPAPQPRLRRDRGRRRRPARDAPPVRRRPGPGMGGHPRHPGRGTGWRLGRRAAPVAADRAADPERAGPARRRWTACR